MITELTVMAIGLVGVSITLAIIIWLAAIFDLIAGPDRLGLLENDKGEQVMPSQALSSSSAPSSAACSECGAPLESESYMFCLSCLRQEPADG